MHTTGRKFGNRELYVPSGSIDLGRQTVVIETRKRAMAVVSERVPRNGVMASWANRY